MEATCSTQSGSVHCSNQRDVCLNELVKLDDLLMEFVRPMMAFMCDMEEEDPSRLRKMQGQWGALDQTISIKIECPLSDQLNPEKRGKFAVHMPYCLIDAF